MLSYSTLGLPEWPLEDLCVLLKQFGYEGMEIALGKDHIRRPGDADFWRRVGEAATQAGIAITNLHLGNPRIYDDPNEPRLLSRDSKKLQVQKNLIFSAFEIAHRLECPLVTAACGPAESDMSESLAWNQLVDVSSTILARRPARCDFLLEHEPEHFFRTSDQISRLHGQTDGGVYSNLDVGHLQVVGEPIGAAIRKLGPIVKNIHLEDIKDRRHRHLIPGEGDIDFVEVGQALADIDYSGPLTADLYPYAAAPIPALIKAKESFSNLLKR